MEWTRRSLLLSPLLTRLDAQVTPELVALAPELEPLARLFESTPRDRCPGLLAAELRKGTPYRQLMAALFLAGARNVNPRPPGFALHCVFVMHAAHQLSLEAPAHLRHVPLFFALDLFKASQDRDKDYSMGSLAGALPSAAHARAEFAAACDAWNGDRAERAAASLARHAGMTEAFDLLWHYGARDFRNIGHKAIFVANAYRTLQVIGWHYAEPVLRSLALGLNDYGPTLKMNAFAMDDQTWAANLRQPPGPLLPGPSSEAAVRALLAAIRTAAPAAACAEAAARLRRGESVASVWDAVHLAAAELTVRLRSGGVITGIHAVSAANALRFAYQSAATPATRWLLLLQAVGWMTQFRIDAEQRPDIGRHDLLAAPAATSRTDLGAVLEQVIVKADEVHFYKFPVAIVEDYYQVSPAFRGAFASAVHHYTKKPTDPTAPAMRRALELL
ncbi:MAG: hypothetical protein NTX13_15020 [Acidobacteria bacterium]|nr:hypothetical protein [Acidobacteriota bacterium]